MKGLLFCILFYNFIYSQSFYPYSAIPFNQVKLTDKFWLPKIEINRTNTIPWSFYQSKITGRIKNFEQAAAREGKLCSKYVFDDSDVYKIIEGAAYSLQVKYDKALDMYLDSLIDIIGKAQEPDGYLFTARTMGDSHDWIGNERYEKEHELSHELYNMGHFYEAATAHFQATGKRSMLNIAIKNANHIHSVFGPGKKSVAPGHQVIEIGLVKLYLATGDKKYLDLSQFFIECRGKREYKKKPREPGATVWETGEYWQDHKPPIEQTEAIGHAVRATYLYSGMADVAALTQNKDYINAILKIWENAAGKKTYITGGIGSAGGWEGFGPEYELPNQSAYCETCAGIGNVYWNHRMFMLTGESKYVDMLERSLYNAILGGIGLDGKSFYYANPMQYTETNGKLSGENKRSPWFACSCCPSNICRFMPSMPGYIYAKKGKELYINLFASSNTKLEIENGRSVIINQESDYPWKGEVRITINTLEQKDMNFDLLIRMPGWATNKIFPTDLYYTTYNPMNTPRLFLNKILLKTEINAQGYLKISRDWKNGDKVKLILPMKAQVVKSSEKINANVNLVSFQKGPIMYSAEFADNGNRTSNLIAAINTKINEKYEEQLLNGVMTLTIPGKGINISRDGQNINTINKPIKLIPYYARSNRGIGEMQLWFPTKVSNLKIESQ